MSKKTKRFSKVSRDPGGFVALPWQVLDCANYRALGYAARSLLVELARQLSGSNNGRLLLTRAFLAERGWTSHRVIERARDELLCHGFIYETCKGQRPNKASWYAVTWCVLDRHDGFDVGASELFKRGAYRDPPMSEEKRKSSPKKLNPLAPPWRPTDKSIGPNVEARELIH
jgi:hypothetical protein